jgi:hypothetical protein
VLESLDDLAGEAAENEDMYRLSGSRLSEQPPRPESESANSKVRPIKS